VGISERSPSAALDYIPLQIQRSILQFWSSQNGILFRLHGILVEVQHLNHSFQPSNRTDLNPPGFLES